MSHSGMGRLPLPCLLNRLVSVDVSWLVPMSLFQCPPKSWRRSSRSPATAEGTEGTRRLHRKQVPNSRPSAHTLWSGANLGHGLRGRSTVTSPSTRARSGVFLPIAPPRIGSPTRECIVWVICACIVGGGTDASWSPDCPSLWDWACQAFQMELDFSGLPSLISFEAVKRNASDP